MRVKTLNNPIPHGRNLSLREAKDVGHTQLSKSGGARLETHIFPRRRPEGRLESAYTAAGSSRESGR